MSRGRPWRAWRRGCAGRPTRPATWRTTLTGSRPRRRGSGTLKAERWRTHFRGFCHYPHRGVDAGRPGCKSTECTDYRLPSPPSFKCNVLRENLSVDSQNIPCAPLKGVVGNLCLKVRVSRGFSEAIRNPSCHSRADFCKQNWSQHCLMKYVRIDILYFTKNRTIHNTQ